MSRKLVLDKLDEIEEAISALESPDVDLFKSDVGRLEEVRSRMEKLISADAGDRPPSIAMLFRWLLRG